MKPLPLLFNPRSGPRGKDPDALMRRLPPSLRARVEPQVFEAPYDFEPAIAQAVAAEGPLLVWGGDGTIHHAGRALLAAGCPVALGAIPGGSGNGLVRGLRTPLEPAGAVQRLLEGRELAMDVGFLDGEPFLNLCGTGFEATVAHAFESGRGRGFSGYARTCLRLYRTERDLELGWEAELPAAADPASRSGRLREAWRGEAAGPPPRAWSLCFAVLPQYGSGLWIAPGADPTDGVLSWVRLHRPGPLDLLTALPALFREGGRTHLREEGHLLRARLVLDRSMPWHMDGEAVAPRDRAELAVRPRAFRMQVTSACPWR
ncbi:MAG: diacylglycerol kinase family protein [Holophagaceae bacterium]